MGRGRISNEEKQKRLQQESIDKFGCVLKSISATEKVEELLSCKRYSMKQAAK